MCGRCWSAGVSEARGVTSPPASKPPPASSLRPIPRPTGGMPRRCCGQAYREWGRMSRGRRCASSSPPAARRDAGIGASRGRQLRIDTAAAAGEPDGRRGGTGGTGAEVGAGGPRQSPRRRSRRPAQRPRVASLQPHRRPRLCRGRQRRLRRQSRPQRRLPTPRRSRSRRPLQLPLLPPLPRRPRRASRFQRSRRVRAGSSMSSWFCRNEGT